MKDQMEESYGYVRGETEESLIIKYGKSLIEAAELIIADPLNTQRKHQDIYYLHFNLCNELQYLEHLNNPFKNEVVEMPPKKTKMSNIYLMKNNRNGYIKIGYSDNPKFREETLQSQEPEVSLIHVETNMPISIEKELHIQYTEKRVRGEWFNLSEEDINNIINQLSPFNVPF